MTLLEGVKCCQDTLWHPALIDGNSHNSSSSRQTVSPGCWWVLASKNITMAGVNVCCVTPFTTPFRVMNLCWSTFNTELHYTISYVCWIYLDYIIIIKTFIISMNILIKSSDMEYTLYFFRLFEQPPQKIHQWSSSANLAIWQTGDQSRQEPGPHLSSSGPQHRTYKTSSVDQPQGPGDSSGWQVCPLYLSINQHTSEPF